MKRYHLSAFFFGVLAALTNICLTSLCNSPTPTFQNLAVVRAAIAVCTVLFVELLQIDVGILHIVEKLHTVNTTRTRRDYWRSAGTIMGLNALGALCTTAAFAPVFEQVDVTVVEKLGETMANGTCFIGAIVYAFLLHLCINRMRKTASSVKKTVLLLTLGTLMSLTGISDFVFALGYLPLSVIHHSLMPLFYVLIVAVGNILGSIAFLLYDAMVEDEEEEGEMNDGEEI